MLSYFPKGSEASIDNHSSASGDIWDNFQYFEKLVNDKQVGIGQIILSAQNKDNAQVVDAIRQITNTCNSCHQQFRN
jgi:cytochrome c556